MEVELTKRGYLRLPAEIVETYFPARVLVALYEAPALRLLPLRAPQAGGLLLKQRTLQGDCAVLVWELIPNDTRPGHYSATWDAAAGSLAVQLEKMNERISQ